MLQGTGRIAAKELAGFFASPAAFLFLGAFLAVTLFVFFWVETFFARNIADVRPLFQWMPVLLIFLVAALTMRLWSEERRAGTLELLLTAPVSPTALILGKFLGAMGLVTIALALTLPLPVAVSLIGPLDWGPVIGGYVAALALASAYVAMGLWVSARSDNQIVSLITTSALASGFFLLGSPAVTALFGHDIANVLRELGAGSRFESITRGVLDLRDLYYYLSLTAVFLALNRLTLERLRWAGNARRPIHNRWRLAAALLIVNLLGANLWLNSLNGIRTDLTAHNDYTLSEATRGYLAQLDEPLLIRGYFSQSTHPLLAPLVPRIRDLLAEYAAAGGDRVRVEFVDPHEDPELEEEAGQKYGIRPVPFQTTSKYQASVVNSYFDLVIAYGDQFEVLNYQDLIEIKAGNETDLEVELRNPEYDITRAVRKVMAGYRDGGNPFDALPNPVAFEGYISGDERLPESLRPIRRELEAALTELRDQAKGKFTVSIRDPDADGGQLAQRLQQDFGFQPMVAGLLDPKPFWFYLTLNDGKELLQIPLPEELDRAGMQRALEAALKRFSPGFLKTVAVLRQEPPAPSMPGMPPTNRGKRFHTLEDVLSESLRWLPADLKDGRVPAEADMLLALAPEGLDRKQLFAIDQFLMQGGTVLLATAPFDVDVARGIEARSLDSGLSDWLAGHGLSIGESLVLDPQSGALPIPVDRRVGGFTVREIQLIDYPYIADIRADGLDADSPVTAGLGQLYLPWTSPITLDADKNKDRAITELVHSSPGSWTSDSLNMVPDLRAHPKFGFEQGGEKARHLLVVALQGRFDSAFAGQPSPLLEQPQEKGEEAKDEDKQENTAFGGVIERSPESARLILLASNAALSDQAMTLAAQALGTEYVKPALFVQNAVDQALEDAGLVQLRGRGHFARTLIPLDRDTQTLWEAILYLLALTGLALIWVVRKWLRNARTRRFEQVMEEVQ